MKHQTSFGIWNDCVLSCFELSQVFDDIEWIRLARLMLQHVPESLGRDLDYMFQSVLVFIFDQDL